jgi:O-methyltransferase
MYNAKYFIVSSGLLEARMYYNTDMHRLVERYPVISDQVSKEELSVIVRECERTLHRQIPGDIVEFGCYSGTTSLFLQRLLQEHGAGKTLHVYDSFAGLPPKGAADESPTGVQFRAGALTSSKADFIKHFKQAHLQLPIIHKAWFEELQPADIPVAVSFAFLDGDFFASITQSFHLIENRLTKGSVIVVDDYQSEALPGAKRAVDTWLKSHQAKLTVEASLAIITLP